MIVALIFTTLFFQGSAFGDSQGISTAQNANELSEPQRLSDKKIFSRASLEDDFTDDIVILTMTRQVSLNLRAYKTNDFPEVNLLNVRNLSTADFRMIITDMAHM